MKSKEGIPVFGRPGSDLLSQVLRHSTIGAEAFNGRVRDGIGFGRLARATRPAKDRELRSKLQFILVVQSVGRMILVKNHAPADIVNENDQANRGISTGKLNASPRLHTQPINVVVFHASQGKTRFEGGFPLRCLQRLSRPYIATLHCGWRHNRSTRDTSTPVLSY